MAHCLAEDIEALRSTMGDVCHVTKARSLSCQITMRRKTCSLVPLPFSRTKTLLGHRSAAYKRCNSSQTNTTDSKVFSKTLLLPKTSFPLKVDPLKSESLYQRLSGEDLYRWQACLLFFPSTLATKYHCTSGITPQAHCSCCTTAHLMRMATFIWVCLSLLFQIECEKEHD